MAAFFALLAFIFAALLAGAVALYIQQRRDLQAARQDYAHIQDQTKRTLARYQPIIDLERHCGENDYAEPS